MDKQTKTRIPSEATSVRNAVTGEVKVVKPSQVDHPVMRWVECASWDDLPDGDWLVKIDKDRRPYHVARKSSKNSTRTIIVGNHYSWDIGNIIAYADFDKYDV